MKSGVVNTRPRTRNQARNLDTDGPVESAMGEDQFPQFSQSNENKFDSTKVESRSYQPQKQWDNSSGGGSRNMDQRVITSLTENTASMALNGESRANSEQHESVIQERTAAELDDTNSGSSLDRRRMRYNPEAIPANLVGGQTEGQTPSSRYVIPSNKGNLSPENTSPQPPAPMLGSLMRSPETSFEESRHDRKIQRRSNSGLQMGRGSGGSSGSGGSQTVFEGEVLTEALAGSMMSTSKSSSGDFAFQAPATGRPNRAIPKNKSINESSVDNVPWTEELAPFGQEGTPKLIGARGHSREWESYFQSQRAASVNGGSTPTGASLNASTPTGYPPRAGFPSSLQTNASNGGGGGSNSSTDHMSASNNTTGVANNSVLLGKGGKATFTNYMGQESTPVVPQPPKTNPMAPPFLSQAKKQSSNGSFGSFGGNGSASEDISVGGWNTATRKFLDKYDRGEDSTNSFGISPKGDVEVPPFPDSLPSSNSTTNAGTSSGNNALIGQLRKGQSNNSFKMLDDMDNSSNSLGGSFIAAGHKMSSANMADDNEVNPFSPSASFDVGDMLDSPTTNNSFSFTFDGTGGVGVAHHPAPPPPPAPPAFNNSHGFNSANTGANTNTAPNMGGMYSNKMPGQYQDMASSASSSTNSQAYSNSYNMANNSNSNSVPFIAHSTSFGIGGNQHLPKIGGSFGSFDLDEANDLLQGEDGTSIGYNQHIRQEQQLLASLNQIHHQRNRAQAQSNRKSGGKSSSRAISNVISSNSRIPSSSPTSSAAFNNNITRATGIIPNPTAYKSSTSKSSSKGGNSASIKPASKQHPPSSNQYSNHANERGGKQSSAGSSTGGGMSNNPSRANSRNASGVSAEEGNLSDEESRGKYRCGKCGKYKVNHVCSFITDAPCRSIAVQANDEEGLETAWPGECYLTVRKWGVPYIPPPPPTTSGASKSSPLSGASASQQQQQQQHQRPNNSNVDNLAHISIPVMNNYMSQSNRGGRINSNDSYHGGSSIYSASTMSGSTIGSRSATNSGASNWDGGASPMVGNGNLSTQNLMVGPGGQYPMFIQTSRSNSGGNGSIPLHGMATLEQIQAARAIMQNLGGGGGSNHGSARPSPVNQQSQFSPTSQLQGYMGNGTTSQTQNI